MPPRNAQRFSARRNRRSGEETALGRNSGMRSTSRDSRRMRGARVASPNIKGSSESRTNAAVEPLTSSSVRHCSGRKGKPLNTRKNPAADRCLHGLKTGRSFHQRRGPPTPACRRPGRTSLSRWSGGTKRAILVARRRFEIRSRRSARIERDSWVFTMWRGTIAPILKRRCDVNEQSRGVWIRGPALPSDGATCPARPSTIGSQRKIPANSVRAGYAALAPGCHPRHSRRRRSSPRSSCTRPTRRRFCERGHRPARRRGERALGRASGLGASRLPGRAESAVADRAAPRWARARRRGAPLARR